MIVQLVVKVQWRVLFQHAYRFMFEKDECDAVVSQLCFLVFSDDSPSDTDTPPPPKRSKADTDVST